MQNGDNHIKANLKVYLPHYSEFNSSEITINGNIITLNACYFMTDFGSISNMENDFYIDIPNNGNYTLKVNLYISTDEVTCNHNSLEDMVTLNFSTPIDGTVSLGTANPAHNTKITVFPNPVKNALTFSEEVSSVRITDVSGKIVKEISTKQKSVNVEHLAKGVYLVTAITKSGEIISKKIVKE